MNARRSLAVAAALALTITSAPAATASGSPGRSTAREVRNERTVRAVVDQLFNGHDVSAVDRYFEEPYIQHNPDVAGGLDGLKAAIPQLPDLHYDVFTVLADGDFVTTDARVLGLGETPKIIVDVFRLDRSRIVEHWDVIQDEVPASETASGNPMISATPVAHSWRDNQRIVTTALDELFGRRDLTALDRYWSDPYVEHAPHATDGVRSLRAEVRGLPAGFSYEPGLIMGDGDRVVVHALVRGAAPEPVISVQIFRLDRGKIVEHWENVQVAVPADQSANGNPMTTPRLDA